MSVERQVEVYTYNLTVVNLTFKIKFPCKLYLEHAGTAITPEVAEHSNHKYIFNHDIVLKKETDKDSIEVIIQIVTDKGTKYVGGVVKLIEREMIGSEGQILRLPVRKCLDNEATCEVRVDQVSSSQVTRKSPSRSPLGGKHRLKSEFGPDVGMKWTKSSKARVGFGSREVGAIEGQTKSEFNFPLTINKRKDQHHHEIANMRKGARMNDSYVGREMTMSGVGGAPGGVSNLEFEVYKEGYNKLKDKYRHEAETARTELNKRIALESSENNLKLQVMRYKLKAEELEKTVTEKSAKIKELTTAVTQLHRKELDIKFLKEQVENKKYTIKSLEETISTLTHDNNELKSLNSERYATDHEVIQALKEQIELIKKSYDDKESEFMRQLKNQEELVARKQYELRLKQEELERSRTTLDDMEKMVNSKTFEFEKLQQNEKALSREKQNDLAFKIGTLKEDKDSLGQKIVSLEQEIVNKQTQITKVEYEKRILNQSNDGLTKENEELRAIKQRYIELTREHKLLQDDKEAIEKSKQREAAIMDRELRETQNKLNNLHETSKKTFKDLEEKFKSAQLKGIQADSHNDSLANQLDKAKRHNESLTKEVSELKQHLKDLRAEIKDKEKQIFSMSSELSEAKGKLGHYDSMLKNETYKLTEQINSLTKELEEDKKRASEAVQTVNHLQLAANKNKMQWLHKEQKAKKQLSYANDKLSALETVKLDLESQILSLQNNVSKIATSEKQANEKLQSAQLKLIQARERDGNNKKQVKILQEKVHSLQHSLGLKAEDYSSLQDEKQNLVKRISGLQTDLNVSRSELNSTKNERERQVKINEFLQNDLETAKEEQAKLGKNIVEKEQAQEILREHLKKQKEENTKETLRFNTLKKQFDKFKETVVENLTSVFGSIPDGLNGQRSSRVNLKLVGGDKKEGRENAQVLSLLVSYGKEARTNMMGTIDQLRQSIRDNEKLSSQYTVTMNKNSNSEQQMALQIANLEEQMSQLNMERQNAHNRYEEEIFLLEGRIKEKEIVVDQLVQQLAEVDFMASNTRAEFDMYVADADKKQSQRNKLIQELKEQIDYQLAEINILENNQDKTQQLLTETENDLRSKEESLEKVSKNFLETQDKLYKSEQGLASATQHLKKAKEQIEELNMELLQIKSQLDNTNVSLVDQERKSFELREFISNLMKQKEDIIKKQLDKSQTLLTYQTELQTLKHEKDSLEDQLKKARHSEEDLKESVKKLSKEVKEEQGSKSEEHHKAEKLSDKIREKDRQITVRDENIARLEERLKREKEKHHKEVRDLQEELDLNFQKLLNNEKDFNEQNLALSNEKERLTEDNFKLNETVTSLQEQIFLEKTTVEQQKDQIIRLERQLAEAQGALRGLEKRMTEVEEELQVREQENFKLQGRVNSLEIRLQTKQRDAEDAMSNLHQDWNSRYEGMCEQFQQRLELVEKEKSFLKQRAIERDHDITKQHNEIQQLEKNLELQKKSNEEKIRLLEEERLAAFSQKNNQNHRLIEESRSNFDKLKAKESQCRRLLNDLELSKNTLSRVESKLREAEERGVSLNRTYLTEVENMKKKEQGNKKFKETLHRSIWKSEREVRKVVQGSIKRILDSVDEKQTLRVMEVTNKLEASVLGAIEIRTEEEN